LQIHVYELLEQPHSSAAARRISILMLGLIIASILGFVLETDPTLYQYRTFFLVLEVVTTTGFVLEYCGRLFACTAELDDATKSEEWMFLRPLNIADLLAILPLFFTLFLHNRNSSSSGTSVLRILRVARLFRIFRLFRLSKYNTGFRVLAQTLLNSLPALQILLFFVGLGMVLFGSLVFYAELFDLYTEIRILQPLYAVRFPSILRAFWWTIVTMTTVGYGDVVPQSVPGRMVGWLSMVTGIFLIALPVAIIGSNFHECMQDQEDS
ncbi:unnamed protein product, partial [Amoebophrya sp. A120]